MKYLSVILLTIILQAVAVPSFGEQKRYRLQSSRTPAVLCRESRTACRSPAAPL
jgi:hypothetical protein